MAGLKKYGWRRDSYDPRDRILHVGAVNPLPLPDFTDLSTSPHMPAVYNQGALGSCHDEETEILTEDGWRKFSDLTGAEKLATVNPKTRELIYELPTRIVRFPYSGNLICADNRSINFRVTPDHNMLVRKWSETKRTLGEDYEFVPAKNLGWYLSLIHI